MRRAKKETGAATEPTTKLVKIAATDRTKNVVQFLESYRDRFDEILPQGHKADNYLSALLSCVRREPKLQGNDVDRGELLMIAFDCAQAGLIIGGPHGHAYPVPFRDGKRGLTVPKLVIGYKGLVHMMYSSGHATRIAAEVVYEGDEFKCVKGTSPYLSHVPVWTKKDRGDRKLYYATVKLKSGETVFETMSHEDMAAHARKYGKADAWKGTESEFIEMARKTVLARLGKKVPKSAVCERVMSYDADTYEDHIEPYEVPYETKPSVVGRGIAAPAGDDFPDDPSDGQPCEIDGQRFVYLADIDSWAPAEDDEPPAAEVTVEAKPKGKPAKSAAKKDGAGASELPADEGEPADDEPEPEETIPFP